MDAALPLLLTDLRAPPPGLARAAHGLAHQAPLRFARRVAEVGAEVALARIRDARLATGPDPRRLLRVEEGEGAPAGGRAASVALYVHFSASGAVSALVRRQLELWREAGFAVVFVTTAPSVPEEDWRAVRSRAALLVQRANLGRDFGAWCDLAPLVRERFAASAEEVLLANDSVLGPIRPLGPVVAALRAGGEGVFGLTESLQGGAHLQSYCVLARGRAAVADLLGFLAGMRLSTSKWLVVQRGELSLARSMLARGHRVAALFGYGRLLDAVLADPEERAALLALHPRLAEQVAAIPDPAQGEAMRRALLAAPLNPTHHLWRPLVRRLGFPFLKTELVRRNPGRLPGVARWPALVGEDAPVGRGMIESHLRALGP
jgi:hypothetical protein